MRSRCPAPRAISSSAWGRRAARMRAFTGGTIGSASPERTSTGVRIRCSQGRLVQPAAAVSWLAYPHIVGGRARRAFTCACSRSTVAVRVERAVQQPRGAAKERGGVVAQRCREQRERERVAGHTAEADRRRGEHEPPDALAGCRAPAAGRRHRRTTRRARRLRGCRGRRAGGRPDGRAGARAGGRDGEATRRCPARRRRSSGCRVGRGRPRAGATSRCCRPSPSPAAVDGPRLASRRAAGGRRPGRR